MKIKLKTKIEKEVEVDVEFPIYVKHDCSGDDYEANIYTKRLSERNHISLHKDIRCRNNEISYELEIENSLVNGCADYFLGTGEYKSNKEEFEKILKEFKEKLNAI